MRDVFVMWAGGKNPAPGKKVRIVYRGSNVPAKGVYDSDKLDWSFHSSGPMIVLYQVQE